MTIDIERRPGVSREGRLPPLKAIEAFVVASNTLSFTTAASMLHVTVAAISRRIRVLETELGVILFKRAHRALKLTPAGESYAKKLAPAIDVIRRASESIRSMPRRNAIKVSTPPSFAAHWLFPRLPHFLSQHEELQVDFDTSVDYVDFDASDVDLAIRFGSGNWPGLRIEPLLDVAVYPVCSPDFFARRPAPGSASDITKHRLLGSNLQPELWQEWLRSAGIAEPPASQFITFDNFHLLYEAAVNGLGIAMGLDAIVEPYLDSGTLIRLFDMPCELSKKFYIVSRARDRDRRPVQSFCTWLTQEAAIWQNRHSLAADLAHRPQHAVLPQRLSK